jgi:hypothetical protein
MVAAPVSPAGDGDGLIDQCTADLAAIMGTHMRFMLRARTKTGKRRGLPEMPD